MNILKISILLILSAILAGCAMNITNTLPELFETEYLNEKTGVTPINLKPGGRCDGSGLKAVSVVNKEQRTDLYMVYKPQAIIPMDFMDIVAKYMEDKLRESNATIDNKDGNEIYVWMDDVHVDGTMTYGGTVKIKVAIPEINYTHVYSGYEGGWSSFYVISYATNLAIDEFLKDPIVQGYIQCRGVEQIQ